MSKKCLDKMQLPVMTACKTKVLNDWDINGPSHYLSSLVTKGGCSAEQMQ